LILPRFQSAIPPGRWRIFASQCEV
jgi:hypothetical protein